MSNRNCITGRRLIPVLAAAFAAAAFVACAPLDDPAAQQQTAVAVKGAKPNAGTCDLTVTLAAGQGTTFEADLDFDLSFTVTNNSDTDDCYTEPSASIVSGTGVTLQSPAQTPDGFFEIDAGDSATVVGHYHTGDYQFKAGTVAMTMTSGQFAATQIHMEM